MIRFFYTSEDTPAQNLEQQVMGQLKAAMLAKDEVALRSLRAIKAAIILAKTSEGAHGVLKEEDEQKLLQKLVKQRKDSYDIFVKQGREDLARTEKEEIDVIEKFLPKQLNEEELQAELKKIIADVGATQPGDLGKVMGVASKKLAGLADGKAISTMVRTLLS